ncbi:hypothetical protein [uncultured Chryseobacterium sp.]|uniref:hypothetical protein n=1 Tax=uncultured Chryseobacterium sp. TaxID=259322 RepID=UPI0025E72879|nr:hypothetical protein [uncultured Chryseobacterium sp.]
MGYRINLSNVNSVAKLIEGNIISFLEQTFIDENYFEGNLQYIDDLLSEENTDFVSSNPRRFYSRRIDFNDDWREIRKIMASTYNRLRENPERKRIVRNEIQLEILNFFKNLSDFIGGYKYRYLLLPGFENSELNNLLISKEELKKLLRIEASESYLIIQLKSIPQKK